jgi:glycosyltransferase involved in cell wall biosynthesis
MDISVVIPCHNAAPTLTRLLESLDQQTLNKSQYEVLVIDDGSTDNSPQLAENFKDVRVIKQSCSGPGAARNRGAQEAKGRIILFLDSDLEATSDLLQQHLDA